MDYLAPWIPHATFAFAAFGVLIVILISLRMRRAHSKSVHRRGDGTFQLTCSVCQKEMVLHRNNLAPLSGTECALVARTNPHSVGKKLAEHLCPYCESSHYFALDGKNVEWLGANLYSPHNNTSLCMECRRLLRRPPWPAGTFDGRLAEAPNLAADYGLVCEKCKAVCCVECCTKATRNRSKDGTYHCPRCFRGDVKVIYHP